MTKTKLPTSQILKTWLPLAVSWFFMGLELPALTAFVARLPEPDINLAAYGVVFNLALIIEAPIIMLLAASTALSRDEASYAKLRRFMMAASATLTGLHVLIAFTPLYYFVVENLLGVPPEIVEPARIGLRIMLPWTWAIAYRRFNQGMLIRFGRSNAVGVGTVVRLTTDVVVLTAGFLIGSLPGVVVATLAVAASVVAEAVYVGIVSRPVREGPLRQAPAVEQPLTLRSFLEFYTPLALTSLLTLIANPIGSAALSRMPDALNSLAAWPVVMGLVFLLRSIGIAYNEVVVALLDEPGSSHNLRRFSTWLSVGLTLALLLVVATPVSAFWFGVMFALPPHLADLARLGMWLALPLPALSVLQSWYQGAILFSRRTRGITESVVVFLVTIAGLLFAGVAWGGATGLYVGLGAMSISTAVQTAWLWVRSRRVMDEVRRRDTQEPEVKQARAA